MTDEVDPEELQWWHVSVAEYPGEIYIEARTVSEAIFLAEHVGYDHPTGAAPEPDFGKMVDEVMGDEPPYLAYSQGDDRLIGIEKRVNTQGIGSPYTVTHEYPEWGNRND